MRIPQNPSLFPLAILTHPRHCEVLKVPHCAQDRLDFPSILFGTSTEKDKDKVARQEKTGPYPNDGRGEHPLVLTTAVVVLCL